MHSDVSGSSIEFGGNSCHSFTRLVVCAAGVRGLKVKSVTCILFKVSSLSCVPVCGQNGDLQLPLLSNRANNLASSFEISSVPSKVMSSDKSSFF